MDIGTLGFIMSAGALLGAPLSGMALDKYGPWGPISITALSCSVGCLWRGLASSLASLRMGAILLGVGVNMWTVIMGHLVKSFPPSKRSEVISGFGVQIAVLQLVGKGIFPLMEFGLHYMFGIEDALLRYRIHMGMCTLFCFYGTFALFWDKENVVQCEDKTIGIGVSTYIAAGEKYQQKHSDSYDDIEEGGFLVPVIPKISVKEIELVDSTNCGDTKRSSFSDDRSNSTSTSSTFLNEPDHCKQGEKNNFFTGESKSAPEKHHLATTIILTAALLLQSIATTVFTVLWPLLVHDRFNLSAHTFGILTFIASVVSMGAVASFPIIERIDRIGGRLRCVAWCFGVCSLLSLLFCICSFSDFWWGDIGSSINETESDLISNINNSEPSLTQDDPLQQVHFRKQLGLHAFSAIALQSALCFMEPSLKSNLSLIVNSPTESLPSNRSSLGGTMGFLQTLGSIGGMVGNIAGTVMYKMSKDITPNRWYSVFQGGSVPFLTIAFCMAIFSAVIWMLEEPTTLTMLQHIEGHTEVKSDRSCLALRETTYDLKLD